MRKRLIFASINVFAAAAMDKYLSVANIYCASIKYLCKAGNTRRRHAAGRPGVKGSAEVIVVPWVEKFGQF